MKASLLALLAGGSLAFLAQSGGKAMLDNHVSTLQAAKSLTATFNVQKLPGSPVEYTLSYSKPNLLKVDGPTRLLETDGKTIWEFDKAQKTYTETSFSDKAFAVKARSNEVLAWSAFFLPETFKTATDLKPGATRIVKGNQVTELTFGMAPKTITLYVDPKLGMARGASVKEDSGEYLILATKIATSDKPLDAGEFVFSAPADAKKAETTATGETVTYASVAKIMQASCVNCHNSGSHKGGFDASSYAAIMKGGNSGSCVTPGDENSALVKYLTGEMQPRMPARSAPLPADQINLIKAWIKAGAKEN